ncbi:hypothetical protein WJX73_005680 [Symbiochloris irregularis]|uniref:Uncharacterized protein n=1 Tax=Symbiochloris irregularis TaxID=706552 RepID=A0AAW1P0I1_9CHLO
MSHVPSTYGGYLTSEAEFCNLQLLYLRRSSGEEWGMSTFSSPARPASQLIAPSPQDSPGLLDRMDAALDKAAADLAAISSEHDLAEFSPLAETEHSEAPVQPQQAPTTSRVHMIVEALEKTGRRGGANDERPASPAASTPRRRNPLSKLLGSFTRSTPSSPHDTPDATKGVSFAPPPPTAPPAAAGEAPAAQAEEPQAESAELRSHPIRQSSTTASELYFGSQPPSRRGTMEREGSYHVTGAPLGPSSSDITRQGSFMQRLKTALGGNLRMGAKDGATPDHTPMGPETQLSQAAVSGIPSAKQAERPFNIYRRFSRNHTGLEHSKTAPDLGETKAAFAFEDLFRSQPAREPHESSSAQAEDAGVEAPAGHVRAQPFYMGAEGGVGGESSLPASMVELQSQHSVPSQPAPLAQLLQADPGSGDSAGSGTIHAHVDRLDGRDSTQVPASPRTQARDSFEQLSQQMKQNGGSMLQMKEPFALTKG